MSDDSIKIFTIWSDEIGGRLDPWFYQPELQVELNGKNIKTFDEICIKITDGDHGNPQYETSGNGIPYIRVIDVKHNQIDWDGVLKISNDYAGKISKSCFAKNQDVLVSIVGTLGESFLVKENFLPLTVSRGFAILTIKDEVNPEYVLAFTKTQAFLNQLEKYKVGSVQKGVYLSNIKKIKIPIPTLEIQNKVASYIQNAYEEKRQKEEESKKILASIDDFVLGELGIQFDKTQKDEKVFTVWSDEIEGRIDPAFYNSSLKSLFADVEKKYGKNNFGKFISDIYRYPTFYGFEYQTQGIPIIKGENIDKLGFIDPKQEFDCVTNEINEKYKRTQLKKGDLIFTVRGIIGKVGFFDGSIEKANINANVIKITLEKINPEFVWIFLNTSMGQMLIQQLTSGQVQKTITVPDIKNILIPVPKSEIQEKIVVDVKARYQKAKQLKQEAENVIKEAQQQVEQMILA